MKRFFVLILMTICIVTALLSGCASASTMSVNGSEVLLIDEDSALYKAITGSYTSVGSGGNPASRDPFTWDDLMVVNPKDYKNAYYAEFIVLEKTDYTPEQKDDFTFFYKVRVEKVFAGDAKAGDEVFFMQKQYPSRSGDTKVAEYSGIQIFMPGQRFVSYAFLQEQQKMANGDEIQYYVEIPESIGYPVEADGAEYVTFFSVAAKSAVNDGEKLTDTILDQFTKRGISLSEKEYQYLKKDYYNPDTKEWISTSYYPVIEYKKFVELMDRYKSEISG